METAEYLRVLFLFLSGWVDPSKVRNALELTEDEMEEAIALIQERGYSIDFKTIH